LNPKSFAKKCILNRDAYLNGCVLKRETIVLPSQAFIHRVEGLRTGGICFPFKDEYKDEPKLAIYPKTLFGTIHTFLFTYETLVVATLITYGALCVASMLQILHHPNYPSPPQ